MSVRDAMPRSIPLTAIILTHDEEANISPCLAGLAAVDDVVIVDSGSTDATLRKARSARPSVRIFEHPFQDFGDQRNWALDRTSPRHEWVLFVDADEFCEPPLLKEIAGFLEAPQDFVGAYVAGRNYFLGRWLRYSTFYPSYQLRLLKRGHVRYRKEGHGQREIASGNLCYLTNGWRHEPFGKGVAHWIARHNRYSSAEVELLLRLRDEPISWADVVGSDAVARRRALKRLGARVPMRPLARFAYSYGLRGGFRDGYAGLLYCLLTLSHSIHVAVKLEEHVRCAGMAARPKDVALPQRGVG